jgi:hypothetical protein
MENSARDLLFFFRDIKQYCRYDEVHKESLLKLEKKLLTRMAKYTWQDYKIMRIFYLNLKLIQLWRKLKITETNWYDMFGERTDRLAHLITNY